jgi:MFS transporter, CP family, cyanate transporter
VQTTPPELTTKDPMRWRMLALAAMAYGCFGLAVASVPPLVDPIIEDLEMTSGQMGLVLGVWQLVFIGTASPLGSLVDRWGARRAVILGLGLILLSLMLRGLATDFITLLLAVALFGAGGPIISVGMPKVVAQWFSGNDRGPATGAYVVGRDVGSVFALATAASFVIALTGSWRGISLVYGAITLVVILLWLAFGKDAPVPANGPVSQQSSEPDVSPPLAEEPVAPVEAPPNEGFRYLLKIRNVQLVLLLGFVVFFMNHALGAWLPTVLQETGMSLATSGRWVAAGITVGMISNFAVPSLARMGLRSVWLVAMLAGGAVTTIGLVFLSGPALIAMVLIGTVIRLPAMQVLTLVLMETPGVGAKRVGAAAGLFFAIAEIGGFTGPLMMGMVRDSTGSLTAGLWVIAAIAASTTILPLLIRERRA